jgi:hypothetical protein
MFSAVLAFVAFFSFGYCVVDIIQNARSAKRLDEMLKDIEEMQKKG